MKCSRCSKELNRIDLMINEEEKIKLCSICIMQKRTDLDRTGRSSKKDKYKDKDTRKSFF